jgi:hypothetical protein
VAPDASDNKEEKEMKQEIIDTLKKVSKIGRSLGIFTIICLQKTTKEEMGNANIIKNMSAVRISFRANDYVSSDVIIGGGQAVGLADRYAVYSLNGGDKKDYLFSPKLTTDMLNEMLEPYLEDKYKKNRVKTINRKSFDPNVIEITSTLKPIPKNQGFDIIDIPRETKFVCLKGGNYVDY